MPELERRWSAWKEALLQKGALTEADIVELESHVMDSLEGLTRVGLSRDEAMLVTLHRLGDPTLLGDEYRKVNPRLAWARRWYWMTAGFLGFTIALAGIRVLGHLGAWLSLGTGASAAWFSGVTLVGLGIVCVVMRHSTHAPSGRLAGMLRQVTAWIERHPILTAHVGFSLLAGLAIIDRFATGFAWRVMGTEILPAISMFDALAATAAPIGLFLLGRHFERAS